MSLNVKENDKVMMVLPKKETLDTVKVGIELLKPMKEFLTKYRFKPLTVRNFDRSIEFKEGTRRFVYDSKLFKKVEPIIDNSNLKVGDRVIFKLPKGKKLKEYSAVEFVGGLISPMIKQINENNGVFTIKEITTNWEGRDCLYFKEDCHGWVWDSKWFMKIIEEPTEEVIKFKFRSDRRTEVFAFDENGVAMNYGWALRSPDDKYNKEIGMIVAFARLLNIPSSKIDAIVDILLNGAMADITEEPYSEIFEILRRRALKEERYTSIK